MAATFEFEEDNGAATGSPTHGTTTTAARTDVNWKATDDSTGTAYSASPVIAGQNSFDKWQYGHFSGTYDQVLSLLFAHTAGAFGTGVTLVGVPLCTGDGSALAYTTPSQTNNSNLSVTMTSAISIGSGVAVAIGATSPQATGKGTASTANPAYTNYLPTQLQTTTSASPGDTASITLTLQYAEN